MYKTHLIGSVSLTDEKICFYVLICIFSYIDSKLFYSEVKSLSRLWLFATLWTLARQAPLSMGFSRQEYWSGLPFPSPGDLLNPGIEPRSPTLQADALISEPLGNSTNISLSPHFLWRGQEYLDCKEIQPVHSEGDQPWDFFGRNDAKAETSTLATSCEELTHWKRLWCWEGLGAWGEGNNKGWDGWMASLTRWTWVWVNSGSWWWTGRPGVLRFMGSQRVRHDWATELNWTGSWGKQSIRQRWLPGLWNRVESTWVNI